MNVYITEHWHNPVVFYLSIINSLKLSNLGSTYKYGLPTQENTKVMVTIPNFSGTEEMK